MPRKDPCDAALRKRKQGERMTLKEWQLTVYAMSPSSLWHDFFPKFIEENGVLARVRLTPPIWQALWDLAATAHRKMLDQLVTEGRPTLAWSGRNVRYLL